MHRNLRRLVAVAAIGGALLLAPPAGAQDADSPLDRALQKIEALLTELRASANADPAVVKQLEGVAKDLRDEKARASRDGGAGETGGAPPGPGGGGGGGGGFDGRKWLIDRVLDGVELSDKDRRPVEDLLGTFSEDYALARTHKDDRSRQVLRQDVEDRIDRAAPRREASKIKNNLATQLRWMDWGGGRR